MMTADARDILHARAAILARRLEPLERPVDELQFVEFVLQRQRFGIGTEHIRGVESCSAITPVPCTPGWVQGIINVRGEVLTVIDLGTFLGLAGPTLPQRKQALIIAVAGMVLATSVDELTGTQTTDPGKLAPPLPTSENFRAEYVRGITPNGVTLFDSEQLFSDPALLVNAPVEL